MLRRLLGENIEVVFQPSSVAAWAKADRGMIEQVVMNLCVNARDAMPRGGVLTLTTNLACRARGFPDGALGAEPSNFVCLLVRDTGSGIPSSVLPHIFEPFFTTKGVGKGTGLGLATVYGIVKQHQGWVEVESAPDAGSSFRVYLPAWLDEPETAPSPEHPARLRGGSEIILLVEDDLSLRRTAALCLRKLGYGVHEAADGTEALQIWEQQQPHIALLLTDLVMPGSITGLELALRLQQQKPEIKVVLSSGYSADLLKSDSADWQRFAFLPKPYPAVKWPKLSGRLWTENMQAPCRIVPNCEPQPPGADLQSELKLPRGWVRFSHAYSTRDFFRGRRFLLPDALRRRVGSSCGCRRRGSAERPSHLFRRKRPPERRLIPRRLQGEGGAPGLLGNLVPACRAEVPNLVKVHNQYRAQGFECWA